MAEDTSPRNIVIKAEPAVVNITPYGFWHYGKEFLAVVQDTSPPPPYSPVPYYLTGRSIELALKAFLLMKGFSKKDVKNNFGHDLEKLLERAESEGLGGVVTLTPEHKTAIIVANDYYCSKGFEYFEVLKGVKGYPGLPDLKVLHGAASVLVDALEKPCLDAA